METTGQKYTDENEVAWAAGVFEGEGCLTSRKSGWMWQIRMTDVDVIEHVASIWDLNFRMEHKKLQPHYLPTAVIQTSARDKVFEIVCDIYPYLGARRRAKCDEFLQWYAKKEGMKYD